MQEEIDFLNNIPEDVVLVELEYAKDWHDVNMKHIILSRKNLLEFEKSEKTNHDFNIWRVKDVAILSSLSFEEIMRYPENVIYQIIDKFDWFYQPIPFEPLVAETVFDEDLVGTYKPIVVRGPKNTELKIYPWTNNSTLARRFDMVKYSQAVGNKAVKKYILEHNEIDENGKKKDLDYKDLTRTQQIEIDLAEAELMPFRLMTFIMQDKGYNENYSESFKHRVKIYEETPAMTVMQINSFFLSASMNSMQLIKDLPEAVQALQLLQTKKDELLSTIELLESKL